MKMHTNMNVKYIPCLNEHGVDRFWKKINKTENIYECWEWQKGVGVGGYGAFKIKDHAYLAHRVSYFLHYKTDPSNLIVCHKCDNPKCVNPHHLFLGTVQDNNEDSSNKGLAAFSKGETHIKSKLKSDDIIAIRELYTVCQLSQEDIAKIFYVTRRTISEIITRSGWQHIGGETSEIRKWNKSIFK